MRPLALLLTNEADVSADHVVRELRARSVPYLRLNTERLPSFEISVEPDQGRWRLDRSGVAHVLDDVRGIWFRRPEPPAPEYTRGLSPAETTVAIEQWRAVVDGLRVLPSASWVNLPDRNQVAESKIHQLATASAVGFPLPDTRITNSASAVLEFMDGHPRGVVIKALRAPLVASPGDPAFVYTERLPRAFAEQMQGLDPVPFIIQEEIRPKLDIRVTVIDDRVLAASLEVPPSHIDWRTITEPPDFALHELPAEVASRCRGIVRRLGLRFGAIDLVREPQGEYYFLEINPNGEWGWLNRAPGLPIASAIVDALVS